MLKTSVEILASHTGASRFRLTCPGRQQVGWVKYGSVLLLRETWLATGFWP